MSKVELTPEQKAEIRAHVEEGIALGESKEALKQRRRAMRDKFGATLPQIVGITAYKTGGDGNLTLQTAEAAAEQTSTITEPETVTVITTPAATAPEVSSTVTGDHMDYDFPVKREWRKKWQEFLARQIPEADRGDAKVLCLPGKECLEIPVYLELGIKPHNIIGVEGGDEKARATFRENAQRFGIQGVEADMAKFLQTHHEPFDIVSLDFHGQFSHGHVVVLRMVPVRSRAFVLMNELAKREGKHTKLIMEGYAGSHLQSDAGVLTPEEVQYRLNFMDQVHQNPTEELDALRDSATSSAISHHLGAERRGGARPTGTPKVERPSETAWAMENISERAPSVKAMLIVKQVINELVSKLHSQNVAQGVAEVLNQAMDLSAFNEIVIADIEQYKYISPNGAPFNSTFARVENVQADLHEARYLMQFLKDCWRAQTTAIARDGDQAEIGHITFRDKTKRVASDTVTAKSDFLYYKIGQRSAADIQVRTLLNGIEKLIPMHDKQVYSHELSQRETLEV